MLTFNFRGHWSEVVYIDFNANQLSITLHIISTRIESSLHTYERYAEFRGAVPFVL